MCDTRTRPAVPQTPNGSPGTVRLVNQPSPSAHPCACYAMHVTRHPPLSCLVRRVHSRSPRSSTLRPTATHKRTVLNRRAICRPTSWALCVDRHATTPCNRRTWHNMRRSAHRRGCRCHRLRSGAGACACTCTARHATSPRALSLDAALGRRCDIDQRLRQPRRTEPIVWNNNGERGVTGPGRRPARAAQQAQPCCDVHLSAGSHGNVFLCAHAPATKMASPSVKPLTPLKSPLPIFWSLRS